MYYQVDEIVAWLTDYGAHDRSSAAVLYWQSPYCVPFAEFTAILDRFGPCETLPNEPDGGPWRIQVKESYRWSTWGEKGFSTADKARVAMESLREWHARHPHWHHRIIDSRDSGKPHWRD